MFRNRGLLFPAWRDTGKTILSLNILSSKAGKFLSDDIAILKNDGTIYSLPDHVRIRFPNLIKSGNINKFRLFFSTYTRKRIQGAILPGIGKLLKRVRIFPFESLGNLLIHLGSSQGDILLPINDLFPDVKIASSVPLDTVFLLVKTSDWKTTIQDTTLENVIAKMMSALACEIDGSLPEVLDLFRFAFPERGQRLSTEFNHHAHEIIKQALEDKILKQVTLPFKFDPEQVIRKLSASLESDEINLIKSYEGRLYNDSKILVDIN